MLAFLHQFIFPMELFLAILIYVLPLRIRKGGGWRCLLTGLVLLIVEAVWMQFFPQLAGLIPIPGHGDLAALTSLFVYVLLYAVLLVAMLLAILFCYEVTLKEAVLCIMMGYATEHVAYCIRLLVNSATHSQIAESPHLCYLLIHLGAYVFFTSSSPRRWCKIITMRQMPSLRFG